MKTILLIIALLANRGSIAQTVEEWTAQRKTQRKYFLEQIAALTVFERQQNSSNSINLLGLANIGSEKNTEMQAHSKRFNSFRIAKALLSAAEQVSTIIKISRSLIAIIPSTIERIENLKMLQDEERMSLKKMMARLQQKIISNIDVLIDLSSSDEFSMDDGARSQALQNLVKQLEEMKLVTTNVYQAAELLNIQRTHDQSTITSSKTLNSK